MSQKFLEIDKFINEPTLISKLPITFKLLEQSTYDQLSTISPVRSDFHQENNYGIKFFYKTISKPFNNPF